MTDGLLVASLQEHGFAVLPDAHQPADPVERWDWFEDLTGAAYAMARMPVRPSAEGTTYTSTMEDAELHTDHLGVWLPPDLQALHCLRPANDGGGTSLLVDLWQLWQRLLDLGVPWDELQALSPGEALASPTSARLAGYAFGRAFNLLGPGIEIDSLPLAAFADRHGLLHRVDLAPDCLLVFDNHRMAHGRTRFDDPNRLLEKTHAWRIDPLGHPAVFAPLLASTTPAPNPDAWPALTSIRPDHSPAHAHRARARNHPTGVLDLEPLPQQEAKALLTAAFAPLRIRAGGGSGGP